MGSSMLTIGRFEVCSVVTGSIRLDGGAMFGVVPKVLWEKVSDVDEHNRILLATRTLLAVDRAARRVILVDTGCGRKWTPEQAERYAIRYDREAIPNALARFDLTEENVTDVVVTHLHFDHNGGLTDWYDDPGGRTILRYPHARHWIHRKHWEHACTPHLKDRASFLKEDFEALEPAGVLQFVEGEEPPPPFEGLSWWVSHGHTPYQLHPILEGNGKRLIFIGDIAPTVAHLRRAWVMAYDVQPMRTIDEKGFLFGRAIEEGWSVAFPHDPEVGGVVLDGTVDRPIVARTLDLS
ncbi:MAG: MBL fold metallo-hydrolase [Planctomycetota bacterium]|nr:MAG: MBL fold metallo-hydrolase [Planctomycetota bacterium]